MLKDALWMESADQSLWFYYQFLMKTLIDDKAHNIIVRNFKRSDRLEYLDQQINDLKELLVGAEDQRWIYNALLDYTMALWELFDCPPSDEVKQNLSEWLAQLRKLDPMRNGRWDDMARSVGLEE